jgi:ribonuclease HI
MAKVEIYTDGSCNNHTHNSGGYGIVMIYDGSRERIIPGVVEAGSKVRQWSGGSYINTTSARMELLAIVRALEKCDKGDEVKVYSDNQYAVYAVSKGWIFKWEQQNFRSRKNCDLLKQLLKEYYRLSGKVTLEWVRGHDGNAYNELADHLAGMGGQRTKMIKDIRYI